MAPVILEMDVHCLACARKIRNAVKKIYGVEGVWASPETGLVVVDGPVDAAALRWRIQSKMRRAVAVVSDGGVAAGAAPPEAYWRRMARHAPPPYVGMVHLAPPHYGVPPPAYPYRGEPTVSWSRPPSHSGRYHYVADDAFHSRHYVPDDACFYARHY
ncbi:hypothetical protein ACP70R_005935 [Stipagrostis hirtigluma subsp. patula]